MADNKINISDVEKAENSIKKLTLLNDSIDKYIKTLRNQTSGMSSFWKDDKYKETKKTFDETAMLLSKTKKSADSLIAKMNARVKQAKDILNTSISK